VRDASLIALARQAVNVANSLVLKSRSSWSGRSYYRDSKETLVVSGRDAVDGKKVIKKQGIKRGFVG
jgi:hypothetical protein